MKDTFSWLTPKQAALLVGYTPRHIQNMITKGKISATREDGKYYIDKAEFFRVFPEAHRKEQERTPAQHIAEKERLKLENDLLKDGSSKKDEEIDFLRNQIEFISQEKMKMLEAMTCFGRLLENKKQDEDSSNLLDKTIKNKGRFWKLFKR